MPTIRDLVRRAQGGDREAFGRLIEKHRDRLEAVARLRTSAALRGRIEPADIVQEAVARAMESIGEFHWRGEGSFGRWLNAIARNVILKAARDGSKAALLGEPWDLADSSPSAGKRQRREERFDRLEAALASLRPAQREVLRLSRLEGLTAREIAARTGRTPGAVKQLMLRALRRLRRSFGDTESLHLPHRHLEPEADPPRSEGAGGARP